VVAQSTDAAQLPPSDLDGLDPSWSRLVAVPLDNTTRTFHVLDTMPSGQADLTVLCVHGNPSWSYLWRNVLRQLPDGVRGIAIDHLDMGFSERTGSVRRLDDRIDDLCELTDALELSGPVVTIAHDWGGPISLGWAQRHLPQLRGVILTNTAVHQPENAAAPRIIRATRTRTVLRRATVDSTAFIAGAFEMSHPRTPKHIRKGFLAPYRTKERRAAIETFVQDIPLEESHPTAAVLDGVAAGLELLQNVPTLLMWGARDPVFSDLYLHDLEDRLPHADVHRWAHAGHFVSEDAPVAEVAVDWIQNLGESGAPVPAAAEDTSSSRLLDAVFDPALSGRVAIREMTGVGSSITFGELSTRIEQTARGLQATGVEPGDRVAVMIPPGIEMTVALYACWRLGAVAVLVDGALTPKQMSAALNAAYPKHLIGISKAIAAAFALRWPGRRISAEPMSSMQRRVLGVDTDMARVEAAGDAGDLPLPSASDEGVVVFTSGSTGPSKGVRYTFGQLAEQRDLIASIYGITSADSLVAAFAPFAIYGPMLGITSTVPDMDVSAPGSIDSVSLAAAVDAIDATMVFASPAALERLVATEYEMEDRYRAALDNVRVLLSAGAPVRASLLSATKAVFPNAISHTPYGMTEVLPVASISLPELIDAGQGDGVCVGAPVTGVEVRIEPLDEARPSDIGEILARAAHQRLGYDRLWHTTHLASQPAGFHRTGDVGSIDAEGRLWVKGRVQHLIWTNAGPVGPVGLEKLVEDLDTIRSAAVVGVGPKGNQQVVVVVELDNPGRKAALADMGLIDQVRAISDRDVVAVFEIPELPVDRRHNSKIDRTAVAAWADKALAGGPLGKL
jgi:acyl-CoA synthetase (AMP-forming)/AMP-acid ligase II/pimeloyl-ACP methyl ester carboxylesterase